jgi:hypothetical protein
LRSAAGYYTRCVRVAPDLFVKVINQYVCPLPNKLRHSSNPRGILLAPTNVRLQIAIAL